MTTFQTVSKLFQYFQMVSKLSGRRQNCPEFKIFQAVSRLLENFKMNSKIYRWFQNCPDFPGWLPNLPVSFITVWIFPDDLKIFSWCQNCQDLSRWLKNLPHSSEVSKLSRRFQKCQDFPNISYGWMHSRQVLQLMCTKRTCWSSFKISLVATLHF